MTLSLRERAVLEAIGRCTSTSINALEVYFGDLTVDTGGFPPDELHAVIESLRKKGALTRAPGRRSDVVAITSVGVLALQEAVSG